MCYSGYEGDDYVRKRRSVHSLKSTAKSERSAADKSAKRAKITVQNGAEVFHESGLSGNKDVQVLLSPIRHRMFRYCCSL